MGKEFDHALTRYLVYQTDDGGQSLTLRGEQQARSSEQALRAFFAEPKADNDGTFTAISENNVKLRTIQARVKTSVGSPESVGKLAEQEALPV